VRVEGRSTSITVEKLGTRAQVLERSGGADPVEWGKAYAQEMTRQEKQRQREIVVKYSGSKTIEKGEERLFNGGYLFLQQIYHNLGLDTICKEIAGKYKFDFELDAVLSRLVYCRILYPMSKLRTFEQSQRFLERPKFDLQHIYRALDVLAQESDFIQAELYKNSLRAYGRKTSILYYDCTNYFFEIESEDGLRQYGHSKEHRPNPVVQMGLFMDEDGVPLAFSMHKGNTNEQATLRPLEETILSDFGLSKFVVCTDAGLSSMANRKFNDIGNRAFVTTQSLKTMKGFLKDWALDPKGWRSRTDHGVYDLSALTAQQEEQHYEDVFYKERWIKENDLEERLIVTYSPKYKAYQRTIRAQQVDRAVKLIASGAAKFKRNNPNDFKRFIEKTAVTQEGEIASGTLYGIDAKRIEREEAFDGFYAVCTNLEDEPLEIIKVNARRWQIEECFRIMKHEFRARPAYHQKDNRIEAHFMTCFMALVLYRLLERELKDEFSCQALLSCLQEMNFMSIRGEGYIPAYRRNDLTDRLHDAFGFRTDYQIVPLSDMKKIFRFTKKQQNKRPNP
jgi:transposase